MNDEDHVHGRDCRVVAVAALLIRFGSRRHGPSGFTVQVVGVDAATGGPPPLTHDDYPDWPSTLEGLDELVGQMVDVPPEFPRPDLN